MISERKKETNRTWYLANQERRREYTKQWKADNKDRSDAAKKAWEDAHPGYYRERHLITHYGITTDQFDALVDSQHGLCAICDKTTDKPWHVDHDHGCCPGPKSCGRCVRGILCAGCNKGIGLLQDDPAVLEKAAQYLRKNGLG